MLKIHRIMAGVYAANCYIVYSSDTKDGVVIDPGGDADTIYEYIINNKINTKAILLTHAHGDHIGGALQLKELLKVSIYIHELDEELLMDGSKNLSSRMPIGNIEFKADYVFKDKDLLEFGNLKIKVLHTPGHTIGSVSFDIDGVIFSGDTLFQQSIGRTDLYSGSSKQIIKSIKDQLLPYPDETKVFPGHGPETTIGFERKVNMFLR